MWNRATKHLAPATGGLLPSFSGIPQFCLRRGVVLGFIVGRGLNPLLEGGDAAPLNKMSRYLRKGRSGGGQKGLCFALPRHAEAKEKLHLFFRRGAPPL